MDSSTLILVTNDDGVHSPGIIALFKAMKEIGNAYMVAPDRERSAVGHSLTLHRPLKIDELREQVYMVNGTPTDAVVLGVNKILPRKPDLIVSGINKGGNLGDDITYSGTVSAAIEGTILNVPSFAVSLYADKNYHFETAAHYASVVAKQMIANPLPYDTLINVNVPNLQKNLVKGIKLTRQGRRTYNDSIQEVFSPREEKHYWIGGGAPLWKLGTDTDINAVEDGYVSISPIHLDLTNYNAMNSLKKQWAIFHEASTPIKEII